MGFHPQVNLYNLIAYQVRGTNFVDKVDKFQPFYMFNPRFIENLQLGATILRDYLDLLSEKKVKAGYAAKNAKAAQEEAAIKVRLSDFLILLSGSLLTIAPRLSSRLWMTGKRNYFRTSLRKSDVLLLPRLLSRQLWDNDLERRMISQCRARVIYYAS